MSIQKKLKPLVTALSASGGQKGTKDASQKAEEKTAIIDALLALLGDPEIEEKEQTAVVTLLFEMAEQEEGTKPESDKPENDNPESPKPQSKEAKRIFHYLASYPGLPKDFAVKLLMMPDPDIFGPIVRTYRDFTDRELIGIGIHGGPERRFALSERLNPSRELLLYMVTEAEVEAVTRLVENATARLTIRHMVIAGARFRFERAFNEAILRREAEDETFAHSMAYARKGPAPPMPDQVDQDLWRALRQGKLPAEQILRAAIIGDKNMMVQLFAIYSLLPPANIEQLLADEKNGLQMVYQKAGFPKAFFPCFMDALSVGNKRSGPLDPATQRTYIFEFLDRLRLKHFKKSKVIKGSVDLLSAFNQGCTSPACFYWPENMPNMKDNKTAENNTKKKNAKEAESHESPDVLEDAQVG